MRNLIISAALVAASLFGVTAQAAEAPAAPYVELANPVPVAEPGKIEVVELFWYGCPHCYAFEPVINPWVEKLPSDVNFVRTPAALNAVWESNARGYYVAEMRGLVEKTHGPLFAAIHVDKQRLHDQKSLAKFYSRFGISEKDFNGLYSSFPIEGQVARSRTLAIRYQLSGVPAIVVNGKYLVPGEGARTIQVVNALIAKERAGGR